MKTIFLFFALIFVPYFLKSQNCGYSIIESNKEQYNSIKNIEMEGVLFENYYENEKENLKQTNNVKRINKGIVILNLINGKQIKVIDSIINNNYNNFERAVQFIFIKEYKNVPYYLFFVQGNEHSHYLLINKNTGKVINNLIGVPYFSENKKTVICFGDGGITYDIYAVKIYDIKNDNFTLKYSNDNINYSIKETKWINEKEFYAKKITLKFEKDSIDPVEIEEYVKIILK